MSKQWHGGKGDGYKPIQDRKRFSDNWDLAFGKKESKTDEKDKNTPADSKQS